MNIPQFTAQASLYRTSKRYLSSGSLSDEIPSVQVIAAYYPGPGTQHDCSVCNETCAKTLAYCSAGAAAVAVGGCAFGPVTFGISCAGAVGAAATILEGCAAAAAICAGGCATPVLGSCCPKVCSFPSPDGGGCCDSDEACVDRNDPNSRDGCCPSDQVVCGGKCCSQGESCCGNTCCPPNYYCLDDGFCSQFPSAIPFGNPPPPKPPTEVGSFRQKKKCPLGTKRCGNECCPPGLQCCDLGAGRLGCRDNCVA